MASIRNRIEKLEKLQPSGIKNLSDEELNARLSELCNNPEIHDWVVDDTNIEPLRLRAIC